MAEIALEAQERALTGKGAARKLRAEGFIPAIVYGHKSDNKHLAISEKPLTRLVHSGQSNALIELSVDGEKEKRPVIIKEIQADPITTHLLHVDFLQVALDEPVNTVVPVVLVGEEQRAHDGGIVEHILRELEISCLPTIIPESIKVDVSDLKLYDTLNVENLKVPAGIEVTNSPDEVVLSIVAPVIETEEETEEAEDVETTAAEENGAEAETEA